MQQCNLVDKQRDISKRKTPKYEALYERNSDLEEERDANIQSDAPVSEKPSENRGVLSANPFSFLSGVFPGTKWCGTGDIAKNFHDLGEVSFIFNLII